MEAGVAVVRAQAVLPLGRSVIDNPYWDLVEPCTKPSEFPWENGLEVGRFKFDRQEGDPPTLDRHDFVGTYSWSIPDPDSLAFVRNVAYHGLVDPMAGTGYWAYLLAQMHVDVVCYDIDPPLKDASENTWHGDANPWVDVEELDARLAVVKHPDRTLLLSWPPYSMNIGAETINAYKGNRIVYVGEGEGGCCGSPDMFDVLNEEWEEIAEYRPVQWWGLHDRITVYERKSSEKLAAVVTQDRDNSTLRTRAKRVVDVP